MLECHKLIEWVSQKHKGLDLIKLHVSLFAKEKVLTSAVCKITDPLHQGLLSRSAAMRLLQQLVQPSNLAS